MSWDAVPPSPELNANVPAACVPVDNPQQPAMVALSGTAAPKEVCRQALASILRQLRARACPCHHARI